MIHGVNCVPLVQVHQVSPQLHQVLPQVHQVRPGLPGEPILSGAAAVGGGWGGGTEY